MFDVVYPLKDGSDGEELRYSLRSLANFPHRDVYIVGKPPEWVTGVRILDPNKYDWLVPGNPFMDAEARWMTACENPNVSDDFWAFNDDFFIMTHMDTMPYVHRGTLRGGSDNTYELTLGRTRYILSVHNIPSINNYELHVPMLMNKQKRQAINLFLRRDLKRGQVYSMRSVYGNIFDVGGESIYDCKDPDMYDWDNLPVISTSDRSFQGRLGEYIKNQFPERSKYEQ